MRSSLISIPFLFGLFYTEAYGQSFQPNSCDSAKLTIEEYKKCITDSVWSTDINIKVNYITGLKTELLPKYRTIRKDLILTAELQNALRSLRVIYDSVLDRKISTCLVDMDKNQKYVQPKAYVSSLLSFQTFKFYPDVYAMLLNDIHLQLNPKTPNAEMMKYSMLVDGIYDSIPSALKLRLEHITNSFATENDALLNEGFSPLFQGSQSQSELKKYRIIYFLLWME
ncbi:hypothetical protein KJS94_11175 [Flavihumibacter rivuli]|uniref:hypothetical protein n=1 Tax=Flavihumibacter rivuli TaxID=2838156 RepID=UPI001BDE5ABD|nr:hypothetical protein [Flavihumibacter rivuli]ULQ55203.1 hypothetical protein KJS94_11175 [Flavihumibacter rivuli]